MDGKAVATIKKINHMAVSMCTHEHTHTHIERKRGSSPHWYMAVSMCQWTQTHT